jgi:NAD(P)-dependent dehydrogenase (short-subunit alcohol dehydrogenase family)
MTQSSTATAAFDAPANGLRVVVTGGSRGLGLAAAQALHAKGAHVALVGRDPDRVSTAAATLDDGTGRVSAWPVDVASPQAVEQLRLVKDHLGDVDVLIAAAAVMSKPASKLVHTTPADWRDALSVNLEGVVHTLAAFVPEMAQRREGRVIVFSACLGRMSGPGNAGGLAPYRVSKAAVNALVRNTAAEMGNGRRSVFVDAVCPGHCRTDMGGPDAPRSPEEGADTAVWLTLRGIGGASVDMPTGVLWEDQTIVPW